MPNHYQLTDTARHMHLCACPWRRYVAKLLHKTVAICLSSNCPFDILHPTCFSQCLGTIPVSKRSKLMNVNRGDISGLAFYIILIHNLSHVSLKWFCVSVSVAGTSASIFSALVLQLFFYPSHPRVTLLLKMVRFRLLIPTSFRLARGNK